ncbi:uncharacterized protein LCORL isoform X2 [Latimeria chalumnae]|uniref:uncharacterized protein LCORL isoform X2 n=1 Tax=Latimeria chalumnae TaxID=7897 RepID=UPI0006D8E4B1|nr:PREDICTED: ligand-dependent nuclear receptor corepressor-like protein isoform X3 [Latimeria chalumnae]|eukprot:XP_005990495.2 PREDICTED: ligand-dependent nuclear receptor corepressor-like protein isoform X3 [Latimeria chalumnae]
MATYCRSTRCTAERKGFRRELDSWRHKLIHCIGFESILEGLYGPRLQRDLSLFEDCEPEELTDWSMDENCSFCNLRKEAVNDHVSTVGSFQSTPTEESPSQDLPLNCDPNIPLVAQEIMKKMIRQFAIEYVSKSNEVEETRNGSSVESSQTCNGLQANQTESTIQSEQDGPLDLTVNRSQQHIQPEEVLDLSTKKSACSVVSASSSPSRSDVKASSSDTSLGADLVSCSTETSKSERQQTALNKVLSLLCSYHQKLLLNILQFVIQDQSASTSKYNHHQVSVLYAGTHHCPNENHACDHSYNSNGYRLTERCCLQVLRPDVCCLPPLCVCIKNLHSLSCQSTAIGCIKTVVNKICSTCQVRCCAGTFQHYNDSLCATAMNITACSPVSSAEVCDLSEKTKGYSRARSPSPPPLSPVGTEAFETFGELSSDFPAAENKNELHSIQPPSLLPEEKDGNPLTVEECQNKNQENANSCYSWDLLQVNDVESSRSSLNSENDFEKGESSVLFQDLMERINEKLKSIEADNESNVAVLSNGDSSTDTHDNKKIGQFITDLLHNAKANDYSFTELLKQHEKTMENKVIHTRFRRRQETLFAMHNSPDSPSSRRQTLQIKRELASFDQAFMWRKTPDKNVTKSTKSDGKTVCSPNKECLSVSSLNDQENSDLKCPIKSFELPQPEKVTSIVTSNSELLEASTETSKRKAIEKEMDKQYNKHSPSPKDKQSPVKTNFCASMSRTKRNIVPPERFSMYVTEPRKMYYAACFSDHLFRKAPKPKKCPDVFKNLTDKMGESNDGTSPEQKVHIDSCNDAATERMIKGLSHQVFVSIERLESTSRTTNGSSREREPSIKNTPSKGSDPYSKSKEVADKSTGIKQNVRKGLDFKTSKDVTRENSQSTQCFVSCSYESKHSKDINVSNAECGEVTNRKHLGCISPTFEKASNPQTTKGQLDEAHDCCVSSTDANDCLMFNSDDQVKTGNSSVLSYTSPIKLMFVSEVTSSEGVKYTLTSASASSKEDIDSCISAPSTKCFTNTIEDRLLTACDKTACIKSCADNSAETCIANWMTEQQTLAHDNVTMDSSSFVTNDVGSNDVEEMEQATGFPKQDNDYVLKRKPGRPKKIGPQVEKQVKRPIGRPPKPKIDLNECSDNKGEVSGAQMSVSSPTKENIANSSKNITVTVIFGRSRRIRRLVSEDDKHTANALSVNTIESSEFKTDDTESKLGFKDKKITESYVTEKEAGCCGYELIRPVKDKFVLPHPSNSNVICPNWKPSSIVRKPGRPAKVRISGISITVDTVSPQERKISVTSKLPPLEKVFAHSERETSDMENEPCSGNNEKTTRQSTTGDCFGNLDAASVEIKKPVIPLRQTVRLRRPSLNFLRSVESSSAFAQSNALVRKSCKLLLTKAEKKTERNKKISVKSTPTDNSEIASRKEHLKTDDAEFSHNCKVSTDPIPSDTFLRQWPIFSSSSTLLQDLHKKYELVANGWISVARGEFENCVLKERKRVEPDCASPASELSRNGFVELEMSPVKMLFQKECDMDQLCAWFMQTTETQSLSIARKANARNPFEVISTKGIGAHIDQSSNDSSPHVGCVKKHLKKFALTAPAKPAGQLQRQFHIRRKIAINRNDSSRLRRLRQEKFAQKRTQHKNGFLNWKHRSLRVKCQSCTTGEIEKETNDDIPEFQGTNSSEEPIPVLNEIKSHNALQQQTVLPPFTNGACLEKVSKEQTNKPNQNLQEDTFKKASNQGDEINENCWRPETFKECRVFLRKINTPDERNYTSGTDQPSPEGGESINRQKQSGDRVEKNDTFSLDSLVSQGEMIKVQKVGEREQKTKDDRCMKSVPKEANLDTPVSESKEVSIPANKCELPVVKRSANSVEVVKHMNIRKRKRPAIQYNMRKMKLLRLSPINGQTSRSYYSKFQLGPINPVRIPLLGEVSSRAIEYSMTPYHMTLHGCTQHTTNKNRDGITCLA